jgi:tellurite methyltransferase
MINEHSRPKQETMKFSNILGPNEKVIDVAKLIQSGTVLDLGAGQGRDSIFLAEKGFDVTAVERDHSQVEILETKNANLDHKVNVIESDINTFESGQQYDIIVSDMVLHFMSPEEVVETIKKIQNMTKEGGYNIIVAYSDKNPPGKRPYLFRHNELLEYYKDWEIESYEEKPTSWFSFPKGTAPRRNEAVYLLARKSLALL